MTDWAQALKGNWRLVPKIATETQRWAKGAMNVWHKTTCPECGTDTSRGTSANARADLYEAMLAAAPKPPAGLYEAREDGTARRVEADVVGALRAAERALLSPFPMEDQVIARLGTGQSAIEQVRAALAHLTGNNR